MISFWILSLLSWVIFIAPLVTGVTLIASLEYGTFQGAYSEEYNVSYWQKIPFASPPIGQNRFRAPQPPDQIIGLYNSTQTYPECPQANEGSEDCLYLGICSRPWIAGEPLRPVVVSFYGGGFVIGGGSFELPPVGFPILNVSESTDILFVYPNYRLNVFGFLPGREVAEDPASDLNPGLLDQEAALKWVKDNIEKFGGDPDNVSIWGQSAGGGSVIAQSISRKHNPPLFRRSLTSSPFWPKTYHYDSEEAQALYDSMADAVDCHGPRSLQCLKNTDLSALQNASLLISNSNIYTTSTFTWAPVIDGVFLPKPLSEVMPDDLNVEVAWGMYNSLEGESFLPSGLQSEVSSGSPPFNNSEASFNTWLRGYLPSFSELDIELVEGLYPADGATEGISYNDSYTRAGLVYRDSTIACPTYWMGSRASQSGWLGEYSIPPATHGADLEWWYVIWPVQQTDPLHYLGFIGAFASFFQTGNPNTLKLTNSSIAGVPPILSGEEFHITADSFVTSRYSPLEKRCRFWESVAQKIPI